MAFLSCLRVDAGCRLDHVSRRLDLGFFAWRSVPREEVDRARPLAAWDWKARNVTSATFYWSE